MSEKSRSSDDKQISEWWPFVAGFAIGFIVCLFLAADALGSIKEEHNEKHHNGEFIGW